MMNPTRVKRFIENIKTSVGRKFPLGPIIT